MMNEIRGKEAQELRTRVITVCKTGQVFKTGAFNFVAFTQPTDKTFSGGAILGTDAVRIVP
jgi:hypothetical protein